MIMLNYNIYTQLGLRYVRQMPSPILIYGPTASGKSHLAVQLAQRLGAVIVNADALQVYSNWNILSARPTAAEMQTAPHFLYGHVDPDQPYSAGHWLREVKELLASTTEPLIIIGGTGLYFSALTEGLAEIPETPDAIRDAGNHIRLTEGNASFIKRLKNLDPDILERIDVQNGMRLQRAWEVVTATGTPLSEWQANTQAPLIPASAAHLITLNAPVDWQRERIDRRFDQMVDLGALEECQHALESGWNPDLPSSRAIGAQPLISHLLGEISLESAISHAKIQTHQYAKRQRTWAKNRMKTWSWHDSHDPDLFQAVFEQIENSAPKQPLNL